MAMSEPGYPAGLDLTAPPEIARWRPLVQWFLAIPHLVIANVLGRVAYVVAFVSWFIVLFTGKLPEGIAGFQAMYLRYNQRATMYAGFLLEPYPPFTFGTDSADPGNYEGLSVEFEPELEDRNRLTVAFRLLLVIPQFVVLFFVGIAAGVLWIVAWFAVIILGRWPDGLRDFVVGVNRWSMRVEAYFLLLTDLYPPFSLGGGATGAVGVPTAPTPPTQPGVSGQAGVSPA
jgi:uncharacterized protein DUF4389